MLQSKKEEKKKGKRKKIYSSVKNMNCPRCKATTAHTLRDPELGLYVCNICHTVHA